MRVYCMCRTNYSHPVLKMEINTSKFKVGLARWQDSRYRVGRAEFSTRRGHSYFCQIFFLIHGWIAICNQEQKMILGIIVYFTKHQKNTVSTIHAIQPMRVCGMCRTNYSQPVLKMEINTSLFMMGLARWQDPRY
jgi:hypothetical protein